MGAAYGANASAVSGASTSAQRSLQAATSRTVVVLQANIEGGRGLSPAVRLKPVSDQITGASRPDVVLLEEACQSDAAVLRTAHPEWEFAFTPQLTPGGSFPTVGCRILNTTPPLYEPKGDVVGSFAPLSSVTRTDLPDEADLSTSKCKTDPLMDRCRKDYKMTCGLVAFSDTPSALKACVVHLSSVFFEDSTGTQLRNLQTQEIHDSLKGSINNNTRATVIGGDFNARPWTDEMSKIYKLTRSTGTFTGPGLFHEGDQTDAMYWGQAVAAGVTCNANACRTGEYTGGGTTPPNTRQDYVFFSVNAHPSGTSGLVSTTLPNANSDHRMVRSNTNMTFP